MLQYSLRDVYIRMSQCVDEEPENELSLGHPYPAEDPQWIHIEYREFVYFVVRLIHRDGFTNVY